MRYIIYLVIAIVLPSCGLLPNYEYQSDRDSKVGSLVKQGSGSEIITFVDKWGKSGGDFKKVGDIYRYGKYGIDVNNSKAIEYYRKSIEADPDYGSHIGDEYFSKENGFNRDYSLALEFYMKSANSKDNNTFKRLDSWINSMNSIGNIYSQGGFGVSQNQNEAMGWYKRAAENQRAKRNAVSKKEKLYAEIEKERAERSSRKQAQNNNSGGSFLMDMLATAGAIKAQKDGNVEGMQAMANLSSQLGSGTVTSQINQMSQEQELTNQRNAQKEAAAQAQRDAEEQARQEAKLQRELKALETQQRQLAQAQEAQAINHQSQLASQTQASQVQAQVQQRQETQRVLAERQRQLKAQARKQQQERLRQQQLAQTSQQQPIRAAVPQVSYRSCVGTAENSALVRDTVAGSEALVRNGCAGSIKYRVCVRDHSSSLSINSPGSSGELNAGATRWVNIPNAKAANIDAGFAWCGPAGNCSVPDCR